MIFINRVFAAVLISAALTSCQKDKESPIITIAEPTAGETLHWGDELHIEVSFTDDQELAPYRIKLGNEAGDLATDFSIDFQGNMDEKVFDFHEHVIVPDSVGDHYFLHFEVTDAEGKTATQKIELHILP